MKNKKAIAEWVIVLIIFLVLVLVVGAYIIKLFKTG